MPRSTRRFYVALCCALSLIAATTTTIFADKRDFNLNNSSDYVIQHAYVSPTDSSDWGDDILGTDVLNPGQVWEVGFDRGDADTCMWDVKVVTVEGFEVKLPQLNLCVITDVTINN